MTEASCVCVCVCARARVEPPAVGVEHLHGDDVHPHLPSGLLEQFALLSFNSFFSNFNSEGELKYDVHQHLPSGLRERFALLSFNSFFLSFNSEEELKYDVHPHLWFGLRKLQRLQRVCLQYSPGRIPPFCL